jgi:hypothetical protein
MVADLRACLFVIAIKINMQAIKFRLEGEQEQDEGDREIEAMVYNYEL